MRARRSSSRRTREPLPCARARGPSSRRRPARALGGRAACRDCGPRLRATPRSPCATSAGIVAVPSTSSRSVVASSASATIAVLLPSSASQTCQSGSATSRRVLAPPLVTVTRTLDGPALPRGEGDRRLPEHDLHGSRRRRRRTTDATASRPRFCATTRRSTGCGTNRSREGAAVASLSARSARAGASATWIDRSATLFVSSDSETAKRASATARMRCRPAVSGVQSNATAAVAPGSSGTSVACRAGATAPEASESASVKRHAAEARSPALRTVTTRRLASPGAGRDGATRMSGGDTTRSGRGPSTVSSRLAALSSSRDSRADPAPSATT